MEEAVQTADGVVYTNLRVKQKEAILHYIYKVKMRFVSVPTGSGKVLICYYILLVVFKIFLVCYLH